MIKAQARFFTTLIASLFIFSSVFSQSEKERIANYIKQYKELAMSEMKRTGIPASITLAQGLLETGYGQSDLALNANNHFGIKCKSNWTGESVLHDDDKKGECFRKYSSVEDSYRDHSDFLKRPNYVFLFNIDPKDYQGWAYGLKKAGYATNPAYAQKLIKFIEDNNLQDYTLLALENSASSEPIYASADNKEFDLKENSDREKSVTKNFEAIRNIASSSIEQDQKHSNFPKEKSFTINSTKVLFANAGTSLFALATNNGISYSKILEFNELGKVDIIEKDQLIFLEKKQRRGSKDFHVVEANENLHDICQVEGIQLNSVLEFNNLTKESKPAVGEKLYLKASNNASNKLAANLNNAPASM